MYTLDFDDDELRLLRAAVRSCVRNFGHDEADILHGFQALLAKLPEPVPHAS